MFRTVVVAMSARAKFGCSAVEARPTLLLCGAGRCSDCCQLSAHQQHEAQMSTPQSPGMSTATLPGMEPPVMDNQVFAQRWLDQFEGRTMAPTTSCDGMERDG